MKWLILALVFLPQNIHVKRQLPNCDSIKLFIKSFLFSKLKKFANLAKALNFFPALWQSDVKYSSKFSWKSVITPNNFWFFLSHIFVWPIFPQIASNLWREIIRWHLSSFFQNYSKIILIIKIIPILDIDGIFWEYLLLLSIVILW